MIKINFLSSFIRINVLLLIPQFILVFIIAHQMIMINVVVLLALSIKLMSVFLLYLLYHFLYSHIVLVLLAVLLLQLGQLLPLAFHLLCQLEKRLLVRCLSLFVSKRGAVLIRSLVFFEVLDVGP